MQKIDEILRWMTPSEVPEALRLLEQFETHGQMPADEANEWRRRIEGWARFHTMKCGTAPSA